MSNLTALVQKLWNYPPAPVSYGGTGCNMGSLAPARSGCRPSAPQNPFRSPPSGSSLRDDGLSYGAPEMERRLSVAEELESVVTANLQRAARLRQSVLQKAFAGNLLL